MKPNLICLCQLKTHSAWTGSREIVVINGYFSMAQYGIRQSKWKLVLLTHNMNVFLGNIGMVDLVRVLIWCNVGLPQASEQCFFHIAVMQQCEW